MLICSGEPKCFDLPRPVRGVTSWSPQTIGAGRYLGGLSPRLSHVQRVAVVVEQTRVVVSPRVPARSGGLLPAVCLLVRIVSCLLHYAENRHAHELHE